MAHPALLFLQPEKSPLPTSSPAPANGKFTGSVVGMNLAWLRLRGCHILGRGLGAKLRSRGVSSQEHLERPGGFASGECHDLILTVQRCCALVAVQRQDR